GEVAWLRSQIKQRPERRRFEEAPPRAVADLQLGEDRPRVRRPRCLTRAPLPDKPRAKLLEPVDGVEDAANDELRRHRPVPAVLGQPEGDVVAGLAAEAVELAAEPEGDRLARVAPAVPHPEPQVLALADGGGLRDLAAVDEEGYSRV